MGNKFRKSVILDTALTENGAITHASTGSAVLDFYYQSATLRGQAEKAKKLFLSALQEDRILSILALFNLRDIRGGKGERELFRACFPLLKSREQKALIRFVPQYGRWDDVLSFDDGLDLIKEQWDKDMVSPTPSLMAKWLPSPVASSKQTVNDAYRVAKALGLSITNYRKQRASLNRKIDVVEIKMSANEWDKIDYKRVPARAMSKYNKAFLEHDTARFAAYVQAVSSGSTSIKATGLQPYELVRIAARGDNFVAEEQWKALSLATSDENLLVMADGSWSMTHKIHGSKATYLDVAHSLAILIADRNRGAFNGIYLTFSETPQFINVGKFSTLHEKVLLARDHAEISSTNLMAAFDLILKRAIKYKVPQEDMPTTLIIISDMEFNEGIPNFTNLESAQIKYEEAGYTMPRVVFWNVASRHLHAPALSSDPNIILVGGFSQNIFESVLSNDKLSPYRAMEKFLTEKYSDILDVL